MSEKKSVQPDQKAASRQRKSSGLPDKTLEEIRDPGKIPAVVQRVRGESHGLTPQDVLRLQPTLGNQAVGRLLAGQAPQQGTPTAVTATTQGMNVIQRHDKPVMPGDLVPKQITGQKKTWTVSQVLSSGDRDKLKKNLVAFIPGDASPSPQERVDALDFIDHQDPMSMPGGAENAGNAAKVTDAGEVHFNNTLDDYYNTDGSPNAEKIKSTIVHESFHAVSANHTGLQDYSGLVKQGSVQNSPDEAITEYFSLQMYQSVFGKSAQDYQTAYWTPAEGVGATAPDKAKGDLAREQQLPAGWTGQMVGVIKKVLSVDDDKLKEMYFKDPDQFGKMVQGKEDEIKSEWAKLMGKQTLETHGVLTKDYKNPLLEETIREKASELQGLGEADWPAVVKQALTAKNVPKVSAKFGSPYSDTVIKNTARDVLASIPATPPPQTTSQETTGSPTQGELIPGLPAPETGGGTGQPVNLEEVFGSLPEGLNLEEPLIPSK